MSDPRPPDPLDEASGIIQAWKRLGGSWAEHNLTPYMETRLRSLIGVALSGHQATIEALKSQRDKAERLRSEALTQQETRLEFCRKELEELKAKVADCEAEHPPEKPYLEWCAAGKPDVSKLREALEAMGFLHEAHCAMKPHALTGAELLARAALSGPSSPATSTKENE